MEITEQQAGMVFAIMGGVFTALIFNGLSAIGTIRHAWQRGYFKEGLLHGLLFGPIGLLTVRLLPPIHQSTRVLSEQIEKTDVEAGLRNFNLSIALQILGVGVYHGLVLYMLFSRLVPPAITAWSITGLVLIGLGMLAFINACPPLHLMPPAKDYNDYPEDPELAGMLRQEYEAYWNERRVEMLRRYAVLSGILSVVAFFVSYLCFIANGTANLKPGGPWLAGIAVLGVITTIYLIIRHRNAAASYNSVKHLDQLNSPGWPPSVPLSLRLYGIHLMEKAGEKDKQVNLLLFTFLSTRWFFPTAGVISAFYLLTGRQTVPGWLLIVLICTGVLTLIASFPIGQRFKAADDDMRDLGLRVLDILFVINHYEYCFGYNRDCEAETNSAGMAVPVLLESCSDLVIPIGRDQVNHGVRIPRFFRIDEPSQSKKLYQQVILEVMSIGVSIGLTLLIFDAIHTGELNRPASFFGTVIISIFVVLCRKLAVRYASSEPYLAPGWSHLALPGDFSDPTKVED